MAAAVGKGEDRREGQVVGQVVGEMVEAGVQGAAGARMEAAGRGGGARGPLELGCKAQLKALFLLNARRAAATS